MPRLCTQPTVTRIISLYCRGEGVRQFWLHMCCSLVSWIGPEREEKVFHSPEQGNTPGELAGWPLSTQETLKARVN